MEEFRVPKRPIIVQVILPGGEAREVSVFLSAGVPDYSENERLSDLLNREARFIPAQDVATGMVTFFNSVAIAVARTDLEHELREEDRLTILTEHEVEIRLVDGQRLQGLIIYMQPEGRTRLNDYLNDAPQFIRLIQDKRVALVNKRHVAYVEPLSR
ncbi:hypothetical protein [Hyalangium rubrum]|uniref:Uncharacterized protein n=1 Tax=Hyalangium rubrum TaxID=3103134 RepID=A0ABU5GV41_9BACT|nr:hypothetical protein [Hyalangium sp. s54d21]MDY7225038.1 hypothetical protein [Hyalangium sp. s54d21]